MPIFLLGHDCAFPDPQFAEPDGLLAVGGDLSVERLLAAYGQGIFPWYGEGQPLLWWSPDPRAVLFPSELKVSRSMRQVLRRNAFRIGADEAFDLVVERCAQEPRKGQLGTWIVEAMADAYAALHRAGYAHSVEVWDVDGALVGGLYGVCLGQIFFGESMFSRADNASKVALVALAKVGAEWGLNCIDCQFITEHLQRLGAVEIPRTRYLDLLSETLGKQGAVGSWKDSFPPKLDGYAWFNTR